MSNTLFIKILEIFPSGSYVYVRRAAFWWKACKKKIIKDLIYLVKSVRYGSDSRKFYKSEMFYDFFDFYDFFTAKYWIISHEFFMDVFPPHKNDLFCKLYFSSKRVFTLFIKTLPYWKLFGLAIFSPFSSKACKGCF